MEKIFNAGPFPHVLIRQVFDQHQLGQIQIELDYILAQAQSQIRSAPTRGKSYDRSQDLPEYPLDDGRARRDGKELTQKTSLFLSQIIRDKGESMIYRTLEHFFSSHANAFDSVWLEKAFMACMVERRSECLVNFYRSGDYYHEHIDVSAWTMILVLEPQGKIYTGGAMTFEKQSHEILMEHNSILVFPSAVLHGVREIRSDNPDPVRISVTFFLR